MRPIDRLTRDECQLKTMVTGRYSWRHRALCNISFNNCNLTNTPTHGGYTTITPWGATSTTTTHSPVLTRPSSAVFSFCWPLGRSPAPWRQTSLRDISRNTSSHGPAAAVRMRKGIRAPLLVDTHPRGWLWLCHAMIWSYSRWPIGRALTITSYNTLSLLQSSKKPWGIEH